MAELTNLESKIAEVFGLAQAAQQVTKKVAGLVENGDVKQSLERMNTEAAETEQRCAELAGQFDGKKTAIEEKARETKSEAQEMMDAYLGDDADGLDGFEFLVMAEAGELGHVEIVRNERAGGQRADRGVRGMGDSRPAATLRGHAARSPDPRGRGRPEQR